MAFFGFNSSMATYKNIGINYEQHYTSVSLAKNEKEIQRNAKKNYRKKYDVKLLSLPYTKGCHIDKHQMRVKREGSTYTHKVILTMLV